MSQPSTKRARKRCPHGLISPYYCVRCGGNGICKHKRQKQKCKDCKGDVAHNPVLNRLFLERPLAHTEKGSHFHL